jgi:hypothetical protein
MIRLLLLAAAALITVASLSAAALYAGFAVVWMHAPVFQVITVTALLCIIPAAVAWSLIYLAKRM